MEQYAEQNKIEPKPELCSLGSYQVWDFVT